MLPGVVLVVVVVVAVGVPQHVDHLGAQAKGEEAQSLVHQGAEPSSFLGAWCGDKTKAKARQGKGKEGRGGHRGMGNGRGSSRGEDKGRGRLG